jgi:hypothetical protein
MTDDKDGGDKVGYRKPPKHTRWPAGVSGNPRGREKGHKGLKTDLEKALNATNTLENKLTGKKVKGRNQELAIGRLVDRAAVGDLKAQALLFPMIMQILGSEDRQKGPRKLSSQDQELLSEVLASRLAEASEQNEQADCNRLLPSPDELPIGDDQIDQEGTDDYPA